MKKTLNFLTLLAVTAILSISMHSCKEKTTDSEKIETPVSASVDR